MPEFDDPFKSPDPTVIRPRPGAGRRPPSEPSPAPRVAAPAPHVEPLSASALDAVGLGLGPLVRAASPLLLLAGQLRGTLSGPDVQALRRHVLDEIRRFEDRARSAGIQNETVLAARYALCATLDEAVLSTPWGAQSEWTQQSLLVALHREAFGGEKFFEMLDRISRDPKHHIDLIEVQYACLAMGFGGRYHVSDRGQSQLADIQHGLYKRIAEFRGAPPAELSPRWKGIEDRRNRLVKYVPWWVVGAAVAVILVVAFAMFRSWLSPNFNEVSNALAAIRTTGAPAVVSDASLEQYLKNEIDRGVLSVVGGSKIVLSDFFASGSDRFAGAAAVETLTAVCSALDHYPQNGILVVGHTDDVPPKRRFSGNQELSERRADSVAEFLKSRDCLKTDPKRVESEGRGDREAFKSDSGSDYRARSRRVEIILLNRS